MLTDDARAKGTAARTAKAKARAAELEPIIRELRSEGCRSAGDLAWGLNDRGIPAPRGGRWGASQVQTLLARLS